MTGAENVTLAGIDRRELIHSLRTAVAVTGSMLIGRLLRLPEPYWAAIATIMVMQSTLTATWAISKQRFVGTALGTAAGALLAQYAGANISLFAGGIFLLGVICTLLHIDRNAYRYAGITLVIVMMIPRVEPAWKIAIHRFFEISLGIAIGLALTAIWPEAESSPAPSPS